mgnify:CR=1 FL=1|tara:strand:+ start:4128 stop:4343 length:216 start_codon:yes stop_codon:yes gene_type:complete
MTSRGIPEMNNIITHILMAGFMVWIVVTVDKDGRVNEPGYDYQFATKSHCANFIKKFSNDHRCVKVPYQRR